MNKGVKRSIYFLIFVISKTQQILYYEPDVVPQPRDEDGPGIGGPTPVDQAGFCAEPT